MKESYLFRICVKGSYRAVAYFLGNHSGHELDKESEKYVISKL